MEVVLDMASESTEMRAKAKSISDFAADQIWMINDDTVGTEKEIYFDLRELVTTDLKLIAISESNCRDTVLFNNDPSPNPEFDNYYLCQSESVVISALNSENVYYFEDSVLTRFIGKGSNVNIEDVNKDMTIFAINVENINPSKIVEVPVFVSDLSAEFSISHDTINLAFEKEIQLEALSESGSTWNWKINNTNIASKSSVIHSLSEAGVFKIQLNIEDTLGCSAVAEKQIVVFNDPLLGNNNELKSYFSIFPNPADKFVHLTGKNQFKFDTYSIIDTQGRELLTANNTMSQQQTEIINVSELKQGAYYLIIRKGKNEASFLFVVRR
jgi:hypothetical protein